VALARASAATAGPDYWIVWAIVVLSVAGASVASIPPLLVWTLRVKKANWGALATVFYAIAFAIGACILMYIFEPSSRRRIWPLFVFPCMILGYAATLWAAFWILRVRGYRLKIGREVS
jgi:predicted MFS family arabinose efflux permease